LGELVLSKYPFIDSADSEFVKALGDKVFRLTGGVVYSGPFAEMKLVPDSFLTSRPIWIVGCYEQEIDEALCDLITNPPASVIDIGSAHGYYMVGLATQISHIPIIGFEAVEEPHWQEAKLLAQLNGVSGRITQKGFCDTDSLNSVITDRSAILIDCEGAEIDILDPDRSPALKTCRIICEVHDFYRPGITRELVDRFKHTHDICLLLESKRDPAAFRILDGFSNAEKLLAVKESKHIPRGLTSARFLWMKPKLGKS